MTKAPGRRPTNWGEAMGKYERDGVPVHADVTALAEAEHRIGELHEALMRATRDRDRLQRQVRQARMLEGVGQIAAGLAHEISSPTHYVGHNLAFLQVAFDGLLEVLSAYQEVVDDSNPNSDRVQFARDLADKRQLNGLLSRIPQALSASTDGIEQITRIVRATRDLSHSGAEAPALCDLNRLISSAAVVAATTWRHVAKIETDFDAGLPEVVCCYGEVRQLLINIIVNACHAIEEGRSAGDPTGTIRITTALVDSRVVVEVSDTGAGIRDEVRENLFEPFVTTKVVVLSVTSDESTVSGFAHAA